MADTVLGNIQIQALPTANPVDGNEYLHIKQGTGDRKVTIIDAMKPHSNNKNNPHNVTKEQVQLGNVTNDAQLKINANLSDVADKATSRNNLEVYSKEESDNNLAAHVNDKDNPHDVSKEQVGLGKLQNLDISNDFREDADKYASSRALSALFRAIQNEHPVGHLHTTLNPANPSTYLLCGGVWELYAKGQALVGYNPDVPGRGVGTTFGAASKNITTANLPRHSHSVTLGGGDHVHRVVGSTGGGGAHYHSFSGSTSVFDYGTKAGATDVQGNHAHNGSTSVGGRHQHMYAGDDHLPEPWGVAQEQLFRYDAESDDDRWARAYWTSASGDHSHTITTDWQGSHAHNVSTYIGAHSHSFGGNTSVQPDHVHGVDIVSQGAPHIHSGNTDQTGGDAPFNVEQPSLVVYVWRRVS